MNYIILNNNEYFQDKISLNNFKEVGLNESERVDAVFAEITTKILENNDNIGERRDSILPEQWLLRDGGVSFILCKVDRSILYNENEELIEKMFELFSKEHFYIELWNFNVEESYNQLDCFLIAYNKKFGYQEILTDDDSKEEIIKIILKKIEEKIL